MVVKLVAAVNYIAFSNFSASVSALNIIAPGRNKFERAALISAAREVRALGETTRRRSSDMNWFLKKFAFEFISVGICLVAISLFMWAVTWRSQWLNYELFVPETDIPGGLPVVVVLHGRSGTAKSMQDWLGFDELAQQHGYIMVYPQSTYDGWDFGVGVRQAGQAGRRYLNHSRYISDILARVDRMKSINWNRIYIVGVSDGASMAMRFSCSSSTKIAGLVSVAATIAVYSVTDCENARPVSVLLMHGTDDTVMPWSGKMYEQYPVFLSFEESIEWWKLRNGCRSSDSSVPQFERLLGAISVLKVSSCTERSTITAYRIEGGGHTWPGRDHPENRTSGFVNRDKDASRTVIDWIAETRFSME